MIARQFAPNFDHLLRVVDSDHALRALREQLRERAFARPEIRDHQRAASAGEDISANAFPGAAGQILAPELSGERIEIAAHFVRRLSSTRASASWSPAASGISAAAVRSSSSSLAELFVWLRRFQPVEDVLAGAAIFYQPSLLELREMSGNLALAAGEDLLQFGDGKLFALEQEEQADACRIAEQPEWP